MRSDVVRIVKLAAAVALFGLGCEEPAQPPTPDPGPQSQEEVIARLETAYLQHDYDLFDSLIAFQDSAMYMFEFGSPLPDGTSSWNANEELRIHRRMFQPETVLPGDPPLPSEGWLDDIVPHFSRSSPDWTERPEYYRSNENPGGLDPARWRAAGATYDSDVIFITAGTTDFRVAGPGKFVVIEDLAKDAGTPRRFLLYRWIEPAEAPLWSRIKALWR